MTAGMSRMVLLCLCLFLCLQQKSHSIPVTLETPQANRLRLMQSVRCLSGVISKPINSNDDRLRVSMYIEDGFHLAYPRGIDGITAALRIETNGDFDVDEFELISTPKVDELTFLRHEGLVELEAKVKTRKKLTIEDAYFGSFSLNVFNETSGISFSERFLVVPLLPSTPKAH